MRGILFTLCVLCVLQEFLGVEKLVVNILLFLPRKLYWLVEKTAQAILFLPRMTTSFAKDCFRVIKSAYSIAIAISIDLVEGRFSIVRLYREVLKQQKGVRGFFVVLCSMLFTGLLVLISFLIYLCFLAEKKASSKTD